MDEDLLVRRLTAEQIVTLSADEWRAAADAFETLESHDTLLAGELRIIATAAGPAAVERPKRGQRIVRLFSSEDEVRRFVQERLDTYERMWDGCGCKVDYFGDSPATK